MCGDYDGENDSYDRAYVSFINSSTDVDITLDSTYTSTGRYYAGGFIAYQEANEDNSNYGYISIEGSSFNGSINLKAAKGGSLYAGGTAGYSTAGISVKNSRMNMTISAIANSQSESKVCAGGMFGYYSITTGTTQSISCLIEGSVSANAERGTVYAGGTSGYSAGECYYSTYSQDYTTYNVYYTSIISSASVSAESAGGNAYAGGFIGDADYYIEAKVIQTSGNVTATARHYDRSYGTYGGSAYAGGTIGYCSYLNSNSSIITSFTSSGSINATGTKCGAAGGLFGYASISSSALSSSYTTGCVYGSHYAGGLFGDGYSNTITNCYTSGIITGGDGAITGGLIGRSGGVQIKNSKVLGFSPTASGIFIGSSSSSTRIENSSYNANFTITGTNIIGNNAGTTASVITDGTDAPFTHNEITIQAPGASAKSEADSEISQIISIDVNKNTIFSTMTAVAINTETIKSTATITSTSSEIQYKYTTISGEFMNAITRIDTVNMTSLTDIKALNGALASGTYAIRTTEDLKLLQNW